MALYYYFCEMQKAAVYIIFLIAVYFNCLAQNAPVRIEFNQYDKTNVSELEMSIVISGGTEYEVSDFPEIKGFKKGNQLVKHLGTVINGKKETQHVINQLYTSDLGGRVVVPSFDLEINRKIYRVESKIFEFESKNQPAPIIEIEDVEIVAQSNKTSVYVGEGFKINLGFYLSDATTTNWQFPDDIGTQIENLAKKIKPKDCLESRLDILKIEPVKVNVNGKQYSFYKLFEAVYYPLNKQNINIPVVSVKMEKLKNEKPTLQILNSKPINIQCKVLPEHPLRETVPVGDLRLIETMKNGTNKSAGEAFEYGFQIEGNTNFGSINLAELKNNKSFDFFLVNAKTNQSLGHDNGNKQFNFKIIPKEKGKFDLKNYFSLIYFNTEKSKYDTLYSKKKINVVGEGAFNQLFLEKDIFAGIEDMKSEGGIINFKSVAKYIANFIIIILVVFFIKLFKKS